MAQDDFYNDEDAYRKRVLDGLNENGGVAGPQESFPGGSMAAGGFMGGESSSPQPATNPRTYDYEKFRSDWLSGGFNTRVNGGLQSLQDFIATNPNAAGVTLRNEKAYDPSGRFIADMIGDVGGKDSRIFLRGTNNTPKGISPPAGGGVGISPPGSASMGQSVPGSNAGNPRVVGGGGGGGTGGGPPAANDFLTKIRQMIMDRLGAMSKDPSMSDPALAAQSAAYGRARDRAAQDQRAAMAERAAANGMIQGGQSSGGFDTELGGILESAGEDKAGNDAQLLGNEMMQRRAEVQNLSQMALASGDAESARALQLQLAKMDEAIRLKQLAENRRQFDKDLGFRGSQWNDQFGRTMGRDYEDDYRWRVMYGL